MHCWACMSQLRPDTAKWIIIKKQNSFSASWEGIVWSTEGLDRTRRQRKREFFLLELGHHLLPLDIRLSDLDSDVHLVPRPSDLDWTTPPASSLQMADCGTSQHLSRSPSLIINLFLKSTHCTPYTYWQVIYQLFLNKARGWKSLSIYLYISYWFCFSGDLY